MVLKLIKYNLSHFFSYEYESDGERVLLKNWNASEVLYSSDATLTVLKL